MWHYLEIGVFSNITKNLKVAIWLIVSPACQALLQRKRKKERKKRHQEEDAEIEVKTEIKCSQVKKC